MPTPCLALWTPRCALWSSRSSAPPTFSPCGEVELTAASLRNDSVLIGGWSITTLARTYPALLRTISADAFDLVASGAGALDVRHVFALEDAAEAHRLVETRESTGKVVLDVARGRRPRPAE